MARKKTAAAATLFEAAPVASRTLVDEVESSFLDYSMSVIVSRALPDARDGLKPVHRRILWAMHDSGLRPDRPFVKCARVVGDVMGRFHPHGDTAIYDALVRMGQDFSLSHPLIDKHGNFGSPADPPAAQRYTECKLSVLATEMLAGIDEGTVDFEPSYDASDEEPIVLPSRFPNLLVNGIQGIAVGMATNIPPHNLGEICDAAVLLIDRPETTLDGLARVVKGPDFPTGALIMGSDGIAEAYRTGRGSIRLRAVTTVEDSRRGPVILVTEIPYQTSVDAIAGKLAEAVEAGRVDGVRDIRNESGQGDTRLVIELRPDANPQIVLNNLFKHTPAQVTFGINMVALVDGVPRTINLMQALQAWVDHQVAVVTRRTRFRLEKAEARLHILEGLVKALGQIDAIVKLIRASKDRAAARTGLMGTGFDYSEIQANHILDLALGRLTQLGREELVKEQKELAAEVRQLRRILSKRDVLMGVIREELVAIRDAHKIARRTQIVADDTGEISTVALVEDEPLFVTVTARGYVVTRPGRGRGAKVADPGERDAVAQLIETSTLAGVLFFSDRGRAYRMAGHDLPKNRLTAAPNLFQLGDGEQIVAVLDAKAADEHQHIVFATASGAVKRTELAEFVDAGARRDGIVAMKVAAGDRVVSVFPGWDEFEIFVVTREGQGIRFAEEEVRAVGRSAGGIRAMRLRGDDAVIGACAVAHEEQVVLATDAGYAKRLRVDEMPVQARGGAGVRVMRLDRKRGAVVAVAPVADRTLFVLDESTATVAATEIKLVARDAVGAAVPGVRPGAHVARVVASSAALDAD
ncbi:MAG TPA: DNA gyrase subunit A [Acidimicrobiia bacterium]|nr:DNA gyrase subunit A [Acidimicrobiia bacterium]